MPIIRLHNEQGNRNVFYEFNSDDQPLGEGGMGRVFKGRRIDRNNGLVRDVAIKMMFDDLPDHVIERARREASIRIVNDNLVEMIDFVEVNERNAYGQVVATHYHVVSEYLDGVNLDEFLKGKTANHDGSENLVAERLYEEYYEEDRSKFVGFVFRNILSGIIALHYKGYIHRDIDPSNIMVTSDGKIKLIDFGIAREVASMTQQEHHLTSTGQFIGKPYYAAPELVLGDIAHQDFRTDIYALGIMLFQLMTGHLPFDGPMLEVNEKQLKEKLPLDEVQDKTVRKIIAKATEKKQEKRYQTAAEMLVDIDKWIMGKRSGTPKVQKQSMLKPPKPQKPKTKSPKKEKQPKSLGKRLGIAAGFVLLLGLGVFLIQKMSVKPVWQEKVQQKQLATTTSQPLVETPPVKVVKTTSKAVSLMMDRNTASEGLTMLNDLVKEGNYEATFLKSRIYFDPSGNSKDKLFYDEDWARMRQNCGITTDNTEAHLLLLKAFNINDNDYVSLYQLGCDYMSGQRGCERNTKYAAWCFNKASSLLDASNTMEAEQYRKEIKSKMERLKSVKAERPGAITLEMSPEGQDQQLNLELDLDKVSSSNKQDDNWRISNF